MLEHLTIILATMVLVVPLFKRIGLGTVLGYLCGGMLVGPWGTRLLDDDMEQLSHASELGVVFLMFVIGLELQLSRLWALRRTIFGLGSAQVLITTVVIGAIAFGLGQTPVVAGVIGFALSLSSTAFVLQILAEQQELTTRHGRDAFAILLFQDLAAIPAIAILPMLAVSSTPDVTATTDWYGIAMVVLVIVAMVTIGRSLLRIAFRWISYIGSQEVSTAAALLVVIGTALLMQWLHFSHSLGAFLAGMLLADSEFRHQIEADLAPFKGLLLGLFFMTVGMSVNLGLFTAKPLLLVELAVGLCAIKALIILALSRRTGAALRASTTLALTMAAGGEFAFVLLGMANDLHIVAGELPQILAAAITLSMMMTPALRFLDKKVFAPLQEVEQPPQYDAIDEPGNPVVIAGFGRVGQVVSRILRMRGISYTALENSPEHIDFVRKFGNKIYYGDASRLELLAAAKVEEAKLFVLAIGNVETSLNIVQKLRQHYPHVLIYARARNRFHYYRLLDLGVRALHRDTFLSSLELAKDVLAGLDISETEAQRSVAIFKKFDEELLLRQHALHHDEAALIQSATEARDELRELFEADAGAAEIKDPSPSAHV